MSEPVREAEEHPGADDRDDVAVGLQQEDSETTVGQLLDRRRDERHHDEERDERSGTTRVPAVRNQPLLFGRVEVADERQDSLVHERGGVDREKHE